MLRQVKTENGWVRGIEAADPRITAFKGVPFAAPPVGKNRWRAPQPCENWAGIRDCSRFAPISMQWIPGLGDDIYCREWHVDPDIPMSEDCLYLNIWTNAKKADEKMPVLVWFFGGGLQCGYPAEMEFDGERIARRGIVVVTVNYRVGALGFLTHPEITEEAPDAPANFGNLDQQAGLRWVQRNIAAFGGDPAKVTIAGQSAGGGSVMSQLACPDNKGLFRNTAVMSAMIFDPYMRREIGRLELLKDAEKKGEDFFAFLGVQTLKEARGMDAVKLQRSYEKYMESHVPFFTVQDDRFCIGDPIALYRAGKCVDTVMMAGNTGGEFLNTIDAADEAGLKDEAERLFGDKADTFLAIQESRQKTEGLGYAAASGIECTVKGTLSDIAKSGRKGYVYCFDPDIPGWDDPGTFHSSDLWFWFETLAKCWRPFVGRHYDLARQMCDYFCNFIKTGNPNGKDLNGETLPKWGAWTEETPCTMTFTGSGAKPVTEVLPPLKAFLKERIMERMRSIRV
ncbi:MAG: carboxylesterase family protein [Clostridia bacterium]|nr:carboxylesterase family protein [Clostridia bacterium]